MAKKKVSEQDSKKVLKKFDIDFDKLVIQLPNNVETTVIVSEQLLINKDLPADILTKMSKCAAIYARYGIIRSDLITYQEMLNDRLDLKMKEWKSHARLELGGKPSESLVEEKAVLANISEYKDRKKKLYSVMKAIERIKRVMRAIEIQSEMSRSIASYLKKEIGFTDEPNFIGSEKHKKFSDHNREED